MKATAPWLASLALLALACRPSGPSVARADAACPPAPQPGPSAEGNPEPRTDSSAPVLAPAGERPTLKSRAFDEIVNAWSASPFRSPSAALPRGSALVAGQSSREPTRLYEIDLETLEVLRDAPLSTSGSFVRVAASDSGAVAVVNEPHTDRDSGEPVFVFDAALSLKQTLHVRGWGTAADAEGAFAVIANQEADGKGGVLRLIELPSGKELNQRRVDERLADEWVPRAQVLIEHDTVWSLSRGERSYVLRAMSRDLKQLVGSAKLPGAASARSGPFGHPGPHYDDGLLAARPGGVLVLRDGKIESFDAKLRPALPIQFGSKGLPVVDPASGRVLMPDGEAAAGLDARRKDPAVVFRRGVWRWSTDGDVPIEYDAPVAAFFVAGRGVIITRNPSLRISVVDWSAVKGHPGPGTAEP